MAAVASSSVTSKTGATAACSVVEDGFSSPDGSCSVVDDDIKERSDDIFNFDFAIDGNEHKARVSNELGNEEDNL